MPYLTERFASTRFADVRTKAGRALPSVERVLLVDDDAVYRRLLQSAARTAGYDAVTAASAAEARAILAADGFAAFDCIVTDNLMQVETGLELLAWVAETDPTMAVVVNTGSKARETVTATLRAGGAGFLEKPLEHVAVTEAIGRAIKQTRHDRSLQAAKADVRHVGQLQRKALRIGVTTPVGALTRFCPAGDVGGDFVSAFPIADGCQVLIVGDVAGHELASAVIAAYFQGVMRGMLTSGRAMAPAIAGFNNMLVDEWNGSNDADGPPPMSISVCAMVFDEHRTSAVAANAGFPNPVHISSAGYIRELGTKGTSPLGWFAGTHPELTDHRFHEGGLVMLWSDGLEDLAEQRGVSPLAMATRLLCTPESEVADFANGANDDVLVIALPLDIEPAGLERQPRDAWLPVLTERHDGSDTCGIDASQAEWEQQISFAVPGMSEARRLDVLLALREAVLNGMKHGCASTPGNEVTLEVCIRAAARVLRATIDDPGPGHDFDHEQHERFAELLDGHRGLALIHKLASGVIVERHGAQLILDFRY